MKPLHPLFVSLAIALLTISLVLGLDGEERKAERIVVLTFDDSVAS